jgi:hypothetical protein
MIEVAVLVVCIAVAVGALFACVLALAGAERADDEPGEDA